MPNYHSWGGGYARVLKWGKLNEKIQLILPKQYDRHRYTSYIHQGGGYARVLKWVKLNEKIQLILPIQSCKFKICIWGAQHEKVYGRSNIKYIRKPGYRNKLG